MLDKRSTVCKRGETEVDGNEERKRERENSREEKEMKVIDD